ncbi:UNVERIFIED_CONTAM: hypothetical protein FKN15_062758 [Acipenser sinensis]
MHTTMTAGLTSRGRSSLQLIKLQFERSSMNSKAQKWKFMRKVGYIQGSICLSIPDIGNPALTVQVLQGIAETLCSLGDCRSECTSSGILER